VRRREDPSTSRAVLVSEARHNLAVMPLVAVAGAAGVTLALRGRNRDAGTTVIGGVRAGSLAGPDSRSVT
jgi:hypothetical protein